MAPMDQTGGMFRKDGSGARGGISRPLTSREENFPYDSPIVYGQPGHVPPKHAGKSSDDGQGFVPTPRDSAWDDLEEALGTPVDFGISGRGSRTSTVPGGPPAARPGGLDPSGSAWAVMPAGDKVYGRGMSHQVANRGRLGEAWVSLADLPVGAMDSETVDLDQEFEESLTAEFMSACQALERVAGGMSDPEKILMLFDLDADHTAHSLADVGGDRIDAIYKAWRDGGPPGDEELK